jgi:hypothetical protein
MVYQLFIYLLACPVVNMTFLLAKYEKMIVGQKHCFEIQEPKIISFGKLSKL